MWVAKCDNAEVEVASLDGFDPGYFGLVNWELYFNERSGDSSVSYSEETLWEKIAFVI